MGLLKKCFKMNNIESYCFFWYGIWFFGFIQKLVKINDSKEYTFSKKDFFKKHIYNIIILNVSFYIIIHNFSYYKYYV